MKPNQINLLGGWPALSAVLFSHPKQKFGCPVLGSFKGGNDTADTTLAKFRDDNIVNTKH